MRHVTLLVVAALVGACSSTLELGSPSSSSSSGLGGSTASSSSSSSTSGSGSSSGAGSGSSSGADSGSGSGGDSGSSGGADSGSSSDAGGCFETLAAACPPGGVCPYDATWSEAKNDKYWCTVQGGGFGGFGTCGGFSVIYTANVDVGEDYYYDTTTGDLVAVVSWSVGGSQCIAGPVDGFEVPAGCSDITPFQCAKCGDGFVGPGETCDDGPGSVTPCPTTCDDGIACTADVMTGSPGTCDATCANTPITVCANGDGCCAPGCNGSNDSDCPSVCGNGIVEPGETCDGNCPVSCDDGNMCTADILSGSAAACTAACTNGCGDYINPSPPANNCAGGPAWFAWQEVPPCSFSATRLSVHTPSGGTVALFLDGGNKPGGVILQAPLGPVDADGWASATFPAIAINGGQTYWIGHFFQGVCSVTAIGATPTEWVSNSGIGGPWMGPYSGNHWTSRLLCN